MNLYRSRIASYLIWRLVLCNPGFRRRLQSVLIRDRTETRTLIGAPVCMNARSEIGYWRAATQQTANVLFRDEVPQMLTVASLLGEGSVFVDCGANVGLWSANMARLRGVHRGLRILAFEANPDTFARLQRTLAGVAGASAHNVALSDRTRTLEMAEGAVSGVFGVEGGDFKIAGTARAVAARPLDEFLTGERDIVMKIDVEGHELEVLQGAGEALARGRVRAVYIDGYDKAKGAAIAAMLEGHGFRLLNGRTLAPFAAGDYAILAIKTGGA